MAEDARARGRDFRGLSLGSFTSFDAVTRLVNSAVSRSQSIVDEVVRGEAPYGVINERFESVAGYEAYLPNYHAKAYIRETLGVRVVLVRYPATQKGYRVQSAFPVK